MGGTWYPIDTWYQRLFLTDDEMDDDNTWNFADYSVADTPYSFPVGNMLPVANAGPDQIVEAGEGVTLDGTNFIDLNSDDRSKEVR